MKELVTFEIPVMGIDSKQNALIIDNGIARLQGVKSHRVERNKEKIVVTLNPSETSLNLLVETVDSLGFRVVTDKQDFKLGGMHCASCANNIEKTLRSQQGIVNARVNFASGMASIEFIPGIADFKNLAAAVQNIGYQIATGEVEENTMVADQHRVYQQLKNKTLWAVLLSLPIVVIGMFFMTMPYANWTMMALAAPVVFWFGRSFFVHAFRQAGHGKATMDTLVALSTGISFLFSAFNTMNPSFWLNRGLEPHVYFEASAVVIAFLLLGKVLEERAKANTTYALKKLMGLQLNTVTLIREDGHEETLPLAQVMPDDRVLVKPGGKIPVDGEVIAGASYVDESMISGEPLAVKKEIGDKVFAGTINQKGSLQLRAHKVGADTLLANLIKMVQQAQGSKAPVQHLVDKIAGVFVPVVIAIALVSFVIWLLVGGEAVFGHGLMAMVTVLVIACPCALGLATPTAIMVGMGKGAEHGILIKDAESLETALDVNTIILDKTGTITEGKPSVTDWLWAETDMENKAQLKSVFLSLEMQSGHPLADAIVHSLKEEGVQSIPLMHFESIPGKGVIGQTADGVYCVGNQPMLEQQRVTLPESLREKAWDLQQAAKTVIYFSQHDKVVAVAAIADPVKTTSAEAVRKIKALGIEVHLLTGDNQQTAQAVAAQVGITSFHGCALPSDKAAFIQQLQQKGKVVAMVGDGINDSQALAQADLGIAMGKGTDIAMDIAKMTLISSDLLLIPKALRLSRLTVRTIRQNLFWAFVYNLIGIPVAAGILYPFTGFLLNPMLAGAAMALSSVSVVGNSLRLRWVHKY